MVQQNISVLENQISIQLDSQLTSNVYANKMQTICEVYCCDSIDNKQKLKTSTHHKCCCLHLSLAREGLIRTSSSFCLINSTWIYTHPIIHIQYNHQMVIMITITSILKSSVYNMIAHEGNAKLSKGLSIPKSIV